MNLSELAQYISDEERAEQVFLKDGKQVHYVPNEQTITAFSDMIVVLINDINRKHFPANPYFFQCKYCGYRDRCGDKWSYW